MLEIQSKKKKPFVFSYDGVNYQLPGKMPNSLVVAEKDVPRPKVYAGAQKEAYDQMVAKAQLAVFLTEILPPELVEHEDWDPALAGEIFTPWVEYIGLGESSSSDD